MANNNEQFKAFHDAIKATNTRKDTLRKNRDALRERIRKYFKNNHEDYIQPKFCWQGSFAMNTILNPIKDEDGLGAYDLDDGIYFISDDESDKKELDWYHTEIYEAVKDHTSKGAEDNDPCVTVIYADGHHIDLPCYFMITDETPQLSHRKTPWIESDPKGLREWFNKECTDKTNLKKIVRYLKAWCDYVKSEKGKKMPTGCIITMLAAEHFAEPSEDNREDIQMRDVLINMHDALSAEDGFHCIRPTEPGDDLFDGYSQKRKKDFLDELKAFKEDAERAINCKNPHVACLKWQKHFGDRFCCSTAKDEDEDAQKQENTGVLTNNSRFA